MSYGEQLEKSGMPFFQPGNFGINLLKIHGALDTFTFRDGKDLLRVLPAERGSAGVIETLRAVNEEVKYVDAANPARPVKMANGIVYADEDGEMQFLSRSLLAGAFKFDNRMSQVLPIRLLDYFRSNINYVQKLICIGYGFGDIHINQVLRGWLEFSGDRQLEIVAPGLKAIPPPLLHLAPQVRIVDSAATDFLDASGGIVRTRREALEKRLVRWARSRGGGGKKEFEAFLQKFHESHVQAFVEKLKALPRRDGDIDLEALGLDRDELVRRWASELGINVEDLLEAFMKSLEG